jgi:hypothetical protein
MDGRRIFTNGYLTGFRADDAVVCVYEPSEDGGMRKRVAIGQDNANGGAFLFGSGTTVGLGMRHGISVQDVTRGPSSGLVTPEKRFQHPQDGPLNSPSAHTFTYPSRDGKDRVMRASDARSGDAMCFYGHKSEASTGVAAYSNSGDPFREPRFMAIAYRGSIRTFRVNGSGLPNHGREARCPTFAVVPVAGALGIDMLAVTDDGLCVAYVQGRRLFLAHRISAGVKTTYRAVVDTGGRAPLDIGFLQGHLVVLCGDGARVYSLAARRHEEEEYVLLPTEPERIKRPLWWTPTAPLLNLAGTTVASANMSGNWACFVLHLPDSVGTHDAPNIADYDMQALVDEHFR